MQSGTISGVLIMEEHRLRNIGRSEYTKYLEYEVTVCE